MSFTTRRATLDDVEKLVQLRLMLFRETKDFEGEAPPELIEITRRYLREKIPTSQFVSWIAEVDGHMVGISGLVFFEKPPNEANRSGLEAYIMNMYTLPQWRGRGIASVLLQNLIQFVKTTTDARRIWLHTTKDGKHVYENAGFVFTTDDMEYLL